MNYVSKSDSELKRAVEEKVEWCLNIYRNATTEFEEYRIPTPSIKYDLRGRCAGQCIGNRLGDFYIRLNWPLLVKYKEEFIERTVVHEIAHVIAYTISYPMGCKPHGHVWKSVMRNLGAKPIRCHNYDVSNAGGRKRKRWVYKCDCRDDIMLSTTRHNKHRTYRARYRCNRCGATLVFTGYVKTLGG